MNIIKLTIRNKLVRLIWNIVWVLLYRPTPRLVHFWRIFLLRLFDAKIGRGVHAYPSAKVWAPWNLTMLEGSCISEAVDCYCVDKVTIGRNATVSQYSYLCTASHDFRGVDIRNSPNMPLITAPIFIGDYAWVAADVFIGPGVTVGEGAVVGARSTVTKNVEAWSVVAGNPARKIGERKK
jgi:putative colanic acid biosynthesis acetyltransferase WcaF